MKFFKSFLIFFLFFMLIVPQIAFSNTYNEDLSFAWEQTLPDDTSGFGWRIFLRIGEGSMYNYTSPFATLMFTESQQTYSVNASLLVTGIPGSQVTAYALCRSFNAEGESDDSNEAFIIVNIPDDGYIVLDAPINFQIILEPIDPIVLEVITIEAETGTIVAPFENNNGLVGAPNGIAGGSLEIPFEITTPGDYVIHALVKAPDFGANSFMFELDTNGVFDCHLSLSGTDTTIWDVVESGRDNASSLYSKNPDIFTLGVGLHVLKIGNREDDSWIDKVVITNDFSYDPTLP